MIDLRLNSKRLGTHWHYYAWRYVACIAAALLAANLLFTVTKPQIPYEQKVELYVYSGITSTDISGAWEKEILRVLPPDQKAASIYSTPMIEGQDVYSIAAARLAAGEGTIIIMPVEMFQSQMSQGPFLPLDGFLSKLNLPKDIDLSAGTASVQPDENTPAETHVYGIPLDRFKGLGELLNPTGMILTIPFYADKNLSNALIAADWLLAKTEAPAAQEQNPDQFQVVVADNYFAASNAAAWEKEQQGKFLPEMAVKLLPYHIGRESMVADELIASRDGKPGMCIVSRGVFVAMARAGALMPLDDVEYLLKPPEGTDLSAGRETAKPAGKEPAAEHLYGIPLDKCAGLTAVFNPQGMMAVFPTQADEALSSAIDVANWLMAKAKR